MVEGGETLEPTDLMRIARLHVESIDDSLPALLGERFASRLYAFLAISDRERVFVERVEGRIESVCVVSEEPTTLNSRITRATLPSLIRGALGAVLTRPAFRRILWGTLNDASRGTNAQKTPEITYIFTNEQLRGRKLGKRLIERVDERLQEVGVGVYCVKTLDDPANRALAFYDALGFARLETRVDAGRRFVEFRKRLSATSLIRSMKLIVLTNDDSRFGLTILNEMKARGVRVHAVIALHQPLSYDLTLLRYVRKRVGLVQALFFGARRVLHGVASSLRGHSNGELEKDFDVLAEEVHHTTGTNSTETLETLRALEPDVVVIGQTGIIRKRLIDIPKLGILKGHPGILPDYRGIDSAMWAILNDEPDKIGVTVHWVDPGVDTGAVLRKRHVTLSEIGRVGVLDLDERLFDIASAELAETVRTLDVENPPPATSQRKQDGKQYYKMTVRQEREVRRKMKALQ